MRPPLRLTSNDNPRAKAVVALRQQKERRATSLFVAEGVREVGRALACGLTLRELYFHEQTLGVTYDGLTGLIPQLEKVEWAFENGKGASLFEVNTGVLAKMSYCERPEGLVGVFQQPKWTVESLIKDAPGGPALWLIAVGTTKPGNLGAMARSLAAAGGQGILTSDAAVDPFNPNALRASTGAVLSLPILSMPGEEVRSLCKNQGVTIAVTSPRAKMDYSKLDLTKPIAFAIGAEDTGLDSSWLSGKGKKAEGIVEVGIPMARGVVDSLNASTAAAVLLFEAVRQRRAAGA